MNKACPEAEGGGSSVMLARNASRVVYVNFSRWKVALCGVAAAELVAYVDDVAFLEGH